MPSNSYLNCTLRFYFGFMSYSSSLSDVLSGFNAFLVVRNLTVWGGAEEICDWICWKALRMSKRRDGVLVISVMKPKTRL